MTVPERLAALRQKMKEAGVDAYLVPTDDFHGSEYVGEYFKCRKFITGFTGSAGTALIMQDMAGLWTDGRYFLQAEQQLSGSGVTLFKMREEGVPTIAQFLEEHLGQGKVLGCDGRTITAAEGEDLKERLAKKGALIRPERDLIGEIWADRPALSCEPVWSLGMEYAGESAAQKIKRVRAAMEEKGSGLLLLTSLDDIAWLLNIRGNDVACNPVVLSYLLLGRDSAVLYAQEKAFPEEVLSALEADGVRLRGYHQIYEDVKELDASERIWLDPDKVNYVLKESLPGGMRLLREKNPTEWMKACKNSTQVRHMKEAHIKDGAAVTRFIYWLKTRVGKERITELSAARKLEELRRMDDHYIGPSFEPIIAYAQHAAVIHYCATPETDVPLEPGAMLLADTGGQYLEGTTDITRTIVLGETTRREKEFFTRVLRGHLNLASAVFLYGCSGLSFDYLAREPLWEVGEDYNHGTGHGVGFVLNVHEGPNSFHYRAYPGRRAETVLEEGMITSDEPGYYLPGEFGIRHENLLVCEKGEKRPCGQFMHFEPLTLVPFDLEAVLPEQMSEKEKERLNRYHQKVYEAIAPLLEDEERSWLKEATRSI